MNVRQLIRVAIENGSLKDISFERVHDIMDLAMDADAFNKFAKRYPAAAVEFKKLADVGRLPALKLVLKRENKGAGRSNRPFDNAKKVSWTSAKMLSDVDVFKQMGYNENAYRAYYDNWKNDNK